MKNVAFVLPVLVLICGPAMAAKVPLDCKTPAGSAAYSADIVNDGTMNRSVQVTFSTKPSPALASKIVQACVKAAVAKNSAVDALGSAWIGAKPVALGNKKFFAYLSGEKKYTFM
jgi:hypothetical protein